MKHFLFALLLVSSAGTAWSQSGYEAQYPYDPYNPTPQPAQQNYQQSGGGSYAASDSYSKLLTEGYLEGHYAFNDFRGDDELKGGSGFGVNLHVELMKPLFLRFGLDRLTSEDAKAESLELTTFKVGGGAYIPIGSRVKVFGEVGFSYDYASGDGNTKTINTDDFAVYVRPGIRFAVTDSLELSLSVLFNSTDDLNNRVVEGAAYYAVFDWLDLGVGLDVSEDVNSYHIGGRWRW